MPHLDVPGASQYYETSGRVSAPAVLLLHAAIATLRMWDPIVPLLDVDHFVIRADGRGFGQTSADPVPYAETQDARDLLDHLGVEHAIAVGSSRGGAIAIDLALESPERLGGIVTVGSAVGGHPSIVPSAAEAAAYERIGALVAERNWHEAIRLQTETLAYGPNRTPADCDPQFVDRAFEVNLPNAARYHERVRPNRLDPPAFGRLGDLTMPALITVGDQDWESYQIQQRSLVTRIPGADGHIFQGAAHLPSLERPDEFGRVLRDWLTHHSF